MGIKLYGPEAVEFIERLARERDASRGANRFLEHGLIKLDSVIAWAGRSDHALDGSTVEVVYFEGHDSDEAQIAQALPATQAGVERCRIIGRLVDLRMTQAGSGLCLCTSGLRTTPYRALSTRVGKVVAIAFDCSLGVTVREACAIAGIAYPYDAPNPSSELRPAGGTGEGFTSDIRLGIDGSGTAAEARPQADGTVRVRREP